MNFKYLLTIIIMLSLITITTAIPNASFTSNVTTGSTYPLVVQFNVTSTGDYPTVWNWSFGDGRWFNTTNSNFKNVSYQYAVAGKYTVGLTVSNTNGTNTTSIPEYINLTSDNDNSLTEWTHMNGANGSTTFTDEKGIAWTANGNAYISTNQYKYGGASGAFAGTNAYLSATPQSAFNFGTNDFTIEFWVNVTSISGTNDHIFSKTNNPRTQGWGLDCTNGNDTGWDFWMGNDSLGQVFFNASIPNKTWTHIAIERISGTIYLYVNGNLTASKSGFNTNYDTTDPLWIGRQQNNYFNGYLDEVRISNNLARWKSNFTPPYAQYNGTLETNFPDINPNSTFRYKTNVTGAAYIDNVTNGGTRNRTLQIQNITNTSYVVGSITFNPLYVTTTSVQLNTTYYPTGMTLLSSTIDNNAGIITFNISKPTGFSPGVNRASILDYTALYYNYTDGSDNVSQFFGYGYLINGTTSKFYPIHNFLVTQVTFGDWNFTANFTANSLTPLTGSPILFTSTFNGSYPNRWDWSFGDGTFNNGTNSSVTHTYSTSGLKTVSVREYLWQNSSVSNISLKTNYINVTDAAPVASFTSVQSGSYPSVTVVFTDTSTNYPSDWYWDFGDGNTSTLQNPTYIYSNECAIYGVNLRVNNSAGFDWENKTNLVNIPCVTPTPTPAPTLTNTTSAKLATRMLDTQNLLVIGVILIIVAGITAFTVKILSKKSE